MGRLIHFCACRLINLDRNPPVYKRMDWGGGEEIKSNNDRKHNIGLPP